MLCFEEEVGYCVHIHMEASLAYIQLAGESENSLKAVHLLKQLLFIYLRYLFSWQNQGPLGETAVEDAYLEFFTNPRADCTVGNFLQGSESIHTVHLLLTVLMLFTFDNAFQKVKAVLEMFKSQQFRSTVKLMQNSKFTYQLWRSTMRYLRARNQFENCMIMCEICEQRSPTDYVDYGLSLLKLDKYKESFLCFNEYERLQSKLLIPSSSALEEEVAVETSKAMIYHKLGDHTLFLESYKASAAKQKKQLRFAFNAEIV